MTRLTFQFARRTLLAATMFLALGAIPAFGQGQSRSGYDNNSTAVNEYEAFRMWRDRTGRKDATYQDYLDARNRGDIGQPRRADPPRTDRRPDSARPESRRNPDRVRPQRPVARPQNRPRRTERPVRTGPMHQDCRAHLNDYAQFSEFPCIIEWACKKCPTTMVMYANNYEYDKYNRLEKIEYRTAICPNCRYENELSIRFRD